MIHTIARVYACLVLIGIACTGADAQSTRRGVQDRMMLLEYGDRFFAESFVVPSTTSDSGHVIVMFRMANDFLTFTRNTSMNSMGGEFRAPMNVSIELRDSLGIIRSRVSWKDTAYTNNFDETNSKTDFHYGWTRIPVGAGSYSVNLELIVAKESQQRKLKLAPVHWNPGKSSGELTAPIFGSTVQTGPSGSIRPFVYSGNISFGPKDVTALMLVADEHSVEYDYTINQKPYEPRDIRWWTVSDVVGTVKSRPHTSLQVADQSTNDGPYLQQISVPGERNVALLEIPVPLTRMVPGYYKLALIRKGSKDTINVNFSIMWELMPLSLRSIDYAIKSLKYIATEDQIDSLDSGSDTERRTAVMAWWRAKDQTSVTSFNERMAEYYRRVDQAFYAFSTIHEPDGAMTDRGKIYILHGPAQSISKRVAKSSAQQEIWTYTNAVQKSFVFQVDDKNLIKLKSIDDLKKSPQPVK